MTNSKREYNEFIRANLPYGIEYDSARYQYVTFNGKRFVTYLEAKWYIDYLTKFGGGPEDDIRNDLFGTSEPGVWFEANDSTTLFTDVAGTTPVTAPGDAVALQLDKSQGLTLGPELVTNGGFDTDTDWAKETGWTISGGAASYSGGGGPRLSQEIALNSESLYEIKFDLTVTSGSIRFQLSESANNDSNAVTSSTLIETQSVSSFLVAGSTSAFITIRPMVPSTVVSVDNISVKELPGNHRTQATTAARPLYALHPVGGVRNELEYTEEWGVPTSPWTQGSFGGTTTSTTFNDIPGFTVSATAAREFYQRSITLPAATYTISIYGELVSGSPTRAILTIGSGFIVVGDFVDGRASKTFTHAGGALTLRIGIGTDTNDTGSVTLAGIQLEEGSTATNYQRVGSFLDVSEEGKARRGRIWYNGTSHFMQTPTITPGTDKVQVFAGVRKLRNNAQEAVLELNNFAEGGLSVQTLTTFAPWRFGSRGDAAASLANATSNTFTSPVSSIITGLGDISGDSAILRVDGVEIAESTAEQGLGNYANSVLRFGARGGTSLFFNGYEDTSIIRFGPNLDDTTISKVESYVADKTPASELFKLGPELITNGTFDADVSGWTAENAVISLSSNAISVDDSANAGGNSSATQEIPVVSGKRYLISFDVVSETSGAFIFLWNNNWLSTEEDLRLFENLSAGSYSAQFTALDSDMTLGLTTGGTGEAVFDNISVREFIPK